MSALKLHERVASKAPIRAACMPSPCTYFAVRARRAGRHGDLSGRNNNKRGFHGRGHVGGVIGKVAGAVLGASSAVLGARARTERLLHLETVLGEVKVMGNGAETVKQD